MQRPARTRSLATSEVCRVEHLEPRLLLSAAAIGPEIQVNSTTAGHQIMNTSEQGGSMAMDADGDFVVTWSSYDQDGSGKGVYAQRYNAAGVAQGGEFRVNTTTANNQLWSTVAMDAVGDFVVTWTSSGQDGSGNGIYAQRYNAVGVAQGSEFLVNTTTAGTQRASSVAMDAAGEFVVTWTSDVPGGGYGVYAQRYNAAGVAQGGEFCASTTAPGGQQDSTVAMDASGDFVITWSSYGQDGSGFGVYAQRFSATGIAQGSEFLVNSNTGGQQWHSTVAMDAAGDFVVVWRGYDTNGFGVRAQRYNAAGAAQGGEFTVNSSTAGDQMFSSVAMAAGGSFVVTWSAFEQSPDSDNYGVFALQFDANGVAQGGEFLVNTNTFGGQVYSAVAADMAGDFVIGWSSLQQDGSGWGVYAQRYDEPTDTAAPVVAQVLEGARLILNGGQVHSAVGSLTVAFSEEMNQTGGASGASSVTNPANWGLTLNGVDASGAIDSIAFGFNATTNRYEATVFFVDPLARGNYQLTARDSITDLAGNALDGDLSGAAGGNFTRDFTMMRAGSEFLVNTETVGNQSTQTNGHGGSAAMDADGDYVVTWSSYGQDGGSYGVYAQRYNAAGVAQGGEFQVNTTTASSQLYSTVAMDAAGDFVVTWSTDGQDSDGWGVYAQRYSAAGVAQGSEFQVNTTTASSQFNSTVAMDAAGDFVVTWSSYGQDGSGMGIYGQRFSEDGTKQGTEFQVATNVANDQLFSTVAMGASGNFVVTWSSYGQDGSSWGIYGQQFNADGAMQGTEFQVATEVALDQLYSTVAMDAAGNFVVTWSSNNQDGSGNGIYAQRYNAAGAVQGSEFLVNTTTALDQYYSTVAMDAAGDFVVAWTSNGQDNIDGSHGVYAQQFDKLTDTASPIVAQVLDGGRMINAGDKLVSNVTSLTVVFSESLNVTGGASGANSVTNPANWQLTRNGVDVSSNISGITFALNPTTNKYEAVLSFTTPLADGAFQLTARQSIQDLAGNALDGDLNGTPGGDFTSNFLIANLLPSGGETRVNTYTTGNQNTDTIGRGGSIAMDATGNYVATWSSYGQDGSGNGIYAQRYNAAGVAQGGEFRVNTTTASEQFWSTVAMDAAGDFVVTWSSYGQDGSRTGVYAQRYNAAGVAQGSEFQVNTTTSNDQRSSTVAMDAAGDFVVTWSSYGQDGSGWGVYAQHYNAAGVAQGGRVPGQHDYCERSMVLICGDGRGRGLRRLLDEPWSGRKQ